MSHDSSITIAGYVGSEPRFFEGNGDTTDFVSFRLATTRSYFNRTKNTWVDSETIWFTVKAWRGLAKNINDSITKGDAVLVHGVLDTQKWTSPDGTPREALVIEAQSLGPNLARGTAKFRPQRAVAAEPVPENVNLTTGEITGPDPATDEKFEKVVSSFKQTGPGEYTATDEDSLTNSETNEPESALTA
ncbi:single-stranded DNA-binding protein [Populibacterium corticicola]|jgi:single-strand DNA-binding protein|uniref:Single-stranded DNA-binding protein n=1 Tax=Populibacterium corticicola TaxID=1812826 RepID=A0ABW5XH36_9MICO